MTDLWIEVHVTPADDFEGDADITAFDADQKTGLKELGTLLASKLEDAHDGDEVIATITVRKEDED